MSDCSSDDKNIRIDIGADALFDIFLVDADTNTPYDLTGITKADVKLPSTVTAGYETFGIGTGVTVDANPLAGKLTVALDETQTLSLLAGDGQDWELDLKVGTFDGRLQSPADLKKVDIRASVFA